MIAKPRILVVDDEPVVRESLRDWFSADDYPVEMAASGPEAMQKMQESTWDILLTDVKMPGMDGLELQQKAREIDPNVTVIIMTAYASMDSAMKAIKDGAYDYVTKPLDPEDLQQIINRAFEHRQLVRENQELRQRIEAAGGEPDEIVGESPEIEAVRERIGTLASSDSWVLLSGERGVGKELVARAIHRGSDRSHMPMISVRCAAIPASQIAEELFGHEADAEGGVPQARKGMLELANRGTAFLSDLEELSPPIQDELLRVIRDRTIVRVGGTDPIPSEFRVIAASTRDLSAGDAVRPELYRRLSGSEIFIPPLRERTADILPLAQHFLERSSQATGGPTRRISTAAMRVLMEHAWPGNVGELKKVIERAAALQHDEIQAEDLELGATEAPAGTGGLTLDDVERLHIEKVLSRVSGDVTRAAQILGIDPSSLAERARKYGLKTQ